MWKNTRFLYKESLESVRGKPRESSWEAIEVAQVEDEGGFRLWFSREARREQTQKLHIEVTLGLAIIMQFWVCGVC